MSAGHTSTRALALLLATGMLGCASAHHATALQGQGAHEVQADPGPGGPPSPREGRDQVAASMLRERLASLPRCAPGAEVGQLVVVTTGCTRMACVERCCNRCWWSVTVTTKRGEGQPVDAGRVRELLGWPEQALECEVSAWREGLQGVDLDAEAGCVVR